MCVLFLYFFGSTQENSEELKWLCWVLYSWGGATKPVNNNNKKTARNRLRWGFDVYRSYYQLARCPSRPSSYSVSMVSWYPSVYVYIIRSFPKFSNNSCVSWFIGCIKMAWLFETPFLTVVRISALFV